MKVIKCLLFIGIVITMGCQRNHYPELTSFSCGSQFDSLSIGFNHIDSLEKPFVDAQELLIPKVFSDSIYLKKGKGGYMLGWVDWPSRITEEEISRIECKAEQLKQISDVFVIVGIGGSYLGSRAVIEALSNHFNLASEEKPVIVYAGHNMSEDYMHDLLSFLENKDFSLCVISKSGTTLEPALAFRILKHQMDSIYGEDEAWKRTVVITGEPKGNSITPLEYMSRKHIDSTQIFYIPDDIGGRFSVLTAVGLFPIAMAGYDIRELLNGAKTIESACKANQTSGNPVAQYAIARQALSKKGKSIEIMVNYEPRLFYFSEWWKQLYGESLGKEEKGIYPTSVTNSTDLHSMGQYIQGCPEQLFETVISVENSNHTVYIPWVNDDFDSLNRHANKRLSTLNHNAEAAVNQAHGKGGVPGILITIPKISEYTLGEIIYFFEMSCAINGYLMSINAFDQPDVEQYKSIMKDLNNN